MRLSRTDSRTRKEKRCNSSPFICDKCRVYLFLFCHIDQIARTVNPDITETRNEIIASIVQPPSAAYLDILIIPTKTVTFTTKLNFWCKTIDLL